MKTGSTLHGAARAAGKYGSGTIFALNTDGTGFTNLHNFKYEPDGGGPDAVALLGNSLYGVARAYGNFDNGTVFRFSFALPHLNIKRSEANVILTWPTNAIGFALQSTTNLVSPIIWTTNTPAPVIVGGENTVTNAGANAKNFYRLIQ